MFFYTRKLQIVGTVGKYFLHERATHTDHPIFSIACVLSTPTSHQGRFLGNNFLHERATNNRNYGHCFFLHERATNNRNYGQCFIYTRELPIAGIMGSALSTRESYQ